MAIVSTIYRPFLLRIADGTIDLNTDTLKVALVASTYTPSTDHAIWGDVSANEVAAGAGYTAGGESLTGVTWTRSGGVCTLDANDVTWTALTKTFRYGVLYANVTRNGVVNPLLLYWLFDNTPADVSVAGVNWTLAFASTGILTAS